MVFNGMGQDDMAPKYYAVKIDLLNRINTGEFKCGDKLPSESELMAIYKVSRITVRKALEELVADHVVYRVQGKGTFVQNTDETRGSRYRECISSCSNLLRSFHMTPTRRIINRKVIPCPEDVAQRLNLAPGAPVLLYERIYYGDDDPAIYGTSYIALEHLPDFEKYDLAELSMVQIIEEKYHKQIHKFDRKLRAISAPNDIAKKLHILVGFPLLHLTFISRFTGSNIPFEDACLCYRTDILDFLPDNY